VRAPLHEAAKIVGRSSEGARILADTAIGEWRVVGVGTCRHHQSIRNRCGNADGCTKKHPSVGAMKRSLV